MIIGRDVAGPNETVRVVRLADLKPTEIDMRCLLIIGSSQTVWHSTPRATGCSPAVLPTLIRLGH